MTHAQRVKSEPQWQRLFLFMMIALASYLAWVASYLKVDYYDSLLILLNARCIAFGDLTGYSGSRPVILPILLSPILMAQKMVQNPELIFSACHIAMVIFFLLFLIVCYRLFRLHVTREVSWLATFLLVTNRVLIHSAPYCKEDVVAVFLMTGGFYFYLKNLKKGGLSNLLCAGILIGLAIGSRYNYPILFGIIFLYELVLLWQLFKTQLADRHTSIKNLIFKRIPLIFLLPVALYVLIVSIHYSSLGIAPFTTAFIKYLTEPVLYMANLVRQTYPLHPKYHFIFFEMGCAWPIVICFFMGVTLNFRNLRGPLAFYLFCFLIFFCFHAFFVPQQEARFSIPALPPFYLFAALGLKQIAEWVSQKIKTKAAAIALLTVVMLLPVKGAATELAQFQDPVYKVDFIGEVSSYAKKLAPPGRTIYWIGPFYPAHPKNYIFHVEDVTYYIYHLYRSAVFFQTGQFIGNLENALFLDPQKEGEPIFVGPRAAEILSDGDVLIINREKEGYNTKTLPPRLKPLYVERARKAIFDVLVQTDESGIQIFESEQIPNAKITAKTTQDGYLIEGVNIPNGRYELYVKFEKSNDRIPLIILDVIDGKLQFLNRNFHDAAHVNQFVLLYFDSLKTFSLPN